MGPEGIEPPYAAYSVKYLEAASLPLAYGPVKILQKSCFLMFLNYSIFKILILKINFFPANG
jgi:hypothetical protein